MLKSNTSFYWVIIPTIIIGIILGIILKPENASLDPLIAQLELEDLDIKYNEKSFMQAVSNGNIEAVKLFLDIGMSPNTVGITSEKGPGVSALMLAKSNGHQEIVKLLIDKGADIKQLI
jgi:hypothetical protein